MTQIRSGNAKIPMTALINDAKYTSKYSDPAVRYPLLHIQTNLSEQKEIKRKQKKERNGFQGTSASVCE